MNKDVLNTLRRQLNLTAVEIAHHVGMSEDELDRAASELHGIAKSVAPPAAGFDGGDISASLTANWTAIKNVIAQNANSRLRDLTDRQLRFCYAFGVLQIARAACDSQLVRNSGALEAGLLPTDTRGLERLASDFVQYMSKEARRIAQLGAEPVTRAMQ
jgi:hypothetical protein